MLICAATNNQGKLKELRRILEAQGHEVKSLKELDIHIDPEENGETFAENHFGFGQVGESRRDGYGYAAVNVCAFVGEKSDSVIAVENGNKVLVDFKILRFVVCGKGKPEIGGVRH